MSASAGMFIWGIIASIAPLATAWPYVKGLPRVYLSVFLSLPSVFLLTGNTILGKLSDILGRKPIYLMTILFYLAGLLIIFASNNVVLLVIGIALSEIGVGGEEVTTLSLISEDVPIKHRGKFLAFVPNMNNVGSAVIAFVFLYFNSSSIQIQKLYFLIIAFFAVFLALYTRRSIPESFRWLRETGSEKEAENLYKKLKISEDGIRIKEPNFSVSLAFLAILGISQYLTFGLMAYIVGPYYFSPAQVSEIIFYALLGASVAGIIAMFLVDIGRKKYAILSYLGGTISILLILATIKYVDNMLVFLPLLFINMMFSEFAWASRTTLEPELFGTKRRSTSIGLVRVFPILAYIASIYLTASFTLSQYIFFNLALWCLGLVAAIVWMFIGVETKNVSMDYYS
ncbi:sugar transporter [Thermoplasma volcanium GSS1]|uniref:Sugar transporter n=1 Tax=Thermoplasma volcanium (strain ATCC 51530 / DSM 4299 / JCM 9571 / NBRC 15438 / GSS1) TaxID=273116 RepID=Q978Z4_THEVO|nr:sugar transporter [Thermoplasma volcanium GSS1]